MACDCFGYAAASRRPVKRYNLLVPDVFPKKEPPVDRPLDATTERKFKRLYEYLQKTPNRGPKVLFNDHLWSADAPSVAG